MNYPVKVRKYTLSPNEESVRLPDVKTLGLFGGDFPSILVWINDTPFELMMGQVVPIPPSADFSIENIFHRTGTVQLIENAPVNSVSDADAMARAENYVKYRASVNLRSDAKTHDNDSSGIGFISTKGEVRFTVKCTSKYEVMIFPNASAEFINGKPSTMFETDIPFLNASGDTHPGLTSITGYFKKSTLATTWANAVGYDISQVKTIFRGTGNEHAEFIVPQNTAIFATAGAWAHNDFSAHVIETGRKVGRYG